MIRRAIAFYLGLFVLLIVVELAMGAPFTVRLCVEATAYALIALGLNIQWGYGGLFNFAVMGFLMIGGTAVTAMSYPLNMKFWNSDGPLLLLEALAAAAIGAIIVIAAQRAGRWGLRGRWHTLVRIVA